MKYNRGELIRLFDKKRKILLAQERAFLPLQYKEIAINNKRGIELTIQRLKEMRASKDVRDLPDRFTSCYTNQALLNITSRCNTVKLNIERVDSIVEQINLICPCGKDGECIDININLEHRIGTALRGDY